MFKKSVAVILIAIIGVLLCSCGKSKDADIKNDSSSHATPSAKTYTPSKNYVPDDDKTITTVHDNIRVRLSENDVDKCRYSEDLLWVSFTDDESTDDSTNCACVDKNGDVLFYIDDTEDELPEDYDNGFSYIKKKSDNKIIVIDKNGKTKADYVMADDDFNYDQDTYEICVAHGYGYVVIEEKHYDFDNSYYEYVIYNPDKEEVYRFKNEDETVDVEYHGQGVFYFYGMGMYFSKSEKWVADDEEAEEGFASTDKYFEKNMNMVYYDTIGDENANGDYYNQVLFLTPEGDLVSTDELLCDKYGDYLEATDVFYNLSVIHSSNDRVYSYDIKSNKLYELTEKRYLDKINLGEDVYIFDNRIVCTLVGKDNHNYVAVFDKEWNLIMEQVEYDELTVADGRIIVNNNDVYDLEGSKVFSLSDKNSVDIYKEGYRDGAIIAEEDNTDDEENNFDKEYEYVLYDSNGKKMFNLSDIDFSKAKEIES